MRLRNEDSNEGMWTRYGQLQVHRDRELETCRDAWAKERR